MQIVERNVYRNAKGILFVTSHIGATFDLSLEIALHLISRYLLPSHIASVAISIRFNGIHDNAR